MQCHLGMTTDGQARQQDAYTSTSDDEILRRFPSARHLHVNLVFIKLSNRSQTPLSSHTNTHTQTQTHTHKHKHKHKHTEI